MSVHQGQHILVDLDGTLAHAPRGAFDPTHIGLPVQPMLNRVRKWLSEGKDVRIFTARADKPESVKAIRAWLDNLGLQAITEITNQKDYNTAEIYDDRAITIIRDMGIPLETRLALELKKVLDAAGVNVAHGDSYTQAADHGARKIAGALRKVEDAEAHIDAAADALRYVDTKALREAGLNQQADDIERAAKAAAKAVKTLKGK